jgi:hypothetical protein
MRRRQKDKHFICISTDNALEKNIDGAGFGFCGEKSNASDEGGRRFRDNKRLSKPSRTRAGDGVPPLYSSRLNGFRRTHH